MYYDLFSMSLNTFLKQNKTMSAWNANKLLKLGD